MLIPAGASRYPEQKRKDVILAVVASLRDERQVGRVRAVVGVPRALLVGVRRGELVGELARAVEHLAGVVGAVRDLREVIERAEERSDYVFGSRDVSFVKVRTRALGVVRETKKQKKTVSKNLYARAVSKNRAIEKDLLAVVSQRDTFGSRPGRGIAPDRDAP
jgi:hypothetical protein